MVSIIIVSYNTKDLLRQCLQSISKNIKNVNFEIIVVDNASIDSSVKVAKSFPHVKVFENKENVGFSEGNNIGAKRAKGQILLFLNSDTQLLDDNIDKAVELFEKDDKLGAVGGALFYGNGMQQRSYGNFYNLFNVAIMLFGGDKAELTKDRISVYKDVDWVSGGFVFIKKEIFDEIGGFDENFFMYIEDMELCFRLKKMGYKVIFEPRLKASHMGQGSSSRSFAILQIYKGILYFYKKHKTRPEYIILRVMLFIKAAVAFMLGICTGNSYLTSTYRKALAL